MDAINQPLLDIRDLSVAFHQQGGTALAVDRISVEIKRGECVALVGEAVRDAFDPRKTFAR